MKEEKLNNFLKELFEKQIDYVGYDNRMSKTELIDKKSRVIVEQMLREFLLSNRDEKQGVLEAKVFAYEQIISKSNFAPIIDTKQVKTEEQDELTNT